METKNKVQVKIYGQEFTITGETPREHIIKVADHVDRSMHKLAESLPSCPISSLAVLAAVNSTDEYYRSIEGVNELRQKNQQLEKDTEHYVQLWDEAKKNFIQYKEDAQTAIESRDELQKAYNIKLNECRELISRVDALEGENEGLKSGNERLSTKIATKEEERATTSEIVKELEGKYKEMESSFFDIQMENIRLKSELDRYKNNSRFQNKR